MIGNIELNEKNVRIIRNRFQNVSRSDFSESFVTGKHAIAFDWNYLEIVCYK